MVRRLVLLSLHLEPSPEALGLGAASVAAALAGSGLEVQCLEAFLDHGGAERTDALADTILAARPDLVGLSVYSWSAAALAALARRLRERAPGLVLFGGGPLASADPRRFGAEAGLDFLVLGEGEEALPRALRRLGEDGATLSDLEGLDGIWLPASGAPPRLAALARLEGLPSPWTGGCLQPREGGVLWELARGCPFRCSYCYEGKGRRGIRRFPRARLEAELDYFVATGVSQVFVLDPTFDADREGARALLDLLEARAPGLHFKFEVRAELLDRDLCRRFARLGASLQIGLQTARPEVSEAVRRPLDLGAFTRGIGHLNEAGVVFGLDLIYGLPRDDLPGFRRSVDFALGLQPNHLDLFRLSVLPGTDLQEEARALGLVAEEAAPYALLSTPTFSEGDLGRAALLAAACDLFYSRGRAVAWFLQALRPLKARPSSFLLDFGDWAVGAGLLRPEGRDFRPAPGLGSRAIEEAQLAWLHRAYLTKGRDDLLGALGDIVAFNAAWGRALGEGEASELSLRYDPDEVLGPAALDLRAFVGAARPSPGQWRVEATASGPRLRRAGGRRQGGRRGG